MPDYSQYIILYDKDGHEYACPIDALKGKVKDGKELSKEEKEKCLDMSQAVDEVWG
jgi:hypothetical protein